jgi:hypothetical protein
VNVLRRFYSIFKDPFRAVFFSTKPLRFPVQGQEIRFIECDSPQLGFWDCNPYLGGTRSFHICFFGTSGALLNMRGRGTLFARGGSHVMVIFAVVFYAGLVRTNMVHTSQPTRITDRSRSAGQATFQEKKKLALVQFFFYWLLRRHVF